MLILARDVGETVTIDTSDGEIVVMVTKVEANGTVKLGFAAPMSIPIMRTELLERQSDGPMGIPGT